MCEKLKQRAEAKVHPFAISQPVLFTEEMLSQFGDSPTARIYLEAYKLVKEGLEILRQSKFTDGRGITLIARGFLTENSIFQAFPWVYLLLTHIYKVCEEKLRKNPRCFEALVLSFAFQNERKLSVQSAKTDIMKLMCVKNLIQFIREAEPDSLPSEDPFELDKNYSSWLHVLYYHMGSLYTIGHLYEEAAEALENAVNCCPSFYEYKRALGYALLNLYLAKKAPKRISVQFGEHSFSFGQDNVPNELLRDNPILMARKKSKYAPWTVEKLRNTTVRVLKEFLDEAPTCYKTYPNACYYLACIAVTEGNLEEFKQYYERGQDAEEKRLPFLDPVNLPLKDAITPFYELFGTVQSHAGCDNWACKKKVEKKDLKSCVCRKQKYCSK